MARSIRRSPCSRPGAGRQSVNIVHVVRQYPPGIGGVENFASLLAEGQVERGHRVRVVTLDRIFSSDMDKLPREEKRNGVEIKRVPYLGLKKYPIAPSILNRLDGADLVHVHGIDFAADYLALTKIFHKRPMVISTHGGIFHTDFAKNLKKIWFNTITRSSMAAYSTIIASSIQDGEIFERIAPGRVEIVENAVDVEKFRGLANSCAKQMIYFGRLAPNKGLPRLIRWFSHCAKTDAEWKLVIAGKEMGMRVMDLQEIAHAHGVGGRIQFVAEPSNSDLAELIAGSSVYAAASTFEGFGLAAVEAASAGLFPLLSDIAPFRRTVSRLQLGKIHDFDGQEIESFLSAWTAFCNAPPPTERLRAVLTPFDWTALQVRMDEIYESVTKAEVACERHQSGANAVLGNPYDH